jgi:hypothetical protein
MGVIIMLDKGFGIDRVAVGAGIGVNETAKWRPKWKIEKYDGDMNLYAVEEFEGNLLLNEGITELLKLLIGTTATAFNNANAYIGVGDSTTAAAATQTGLQATTNKLYKRMDDTFPSITGQTVTFRATFGALEANFNWREFTVANGNSDSAKNLNRAVENHGTKAQPDTWIVQCSITIS